MKTTDEVEERNGLKFIRLKGGRVLWFWDALNEAKRARTALGTAVSRMFRLLTDRDDLGNDLEQLEWFVDDLETYIGALRKEIARRRGVKGEEGRIARLRNTQGRTPEEAAEFNRKADELERKLRVANHPTGGRS